MNLIQLKIIFRSLLKNKFYSALHIGGVTFTFIFLTIIFIDIRQETGNISPDVFRDQVISVSFVPLDNGKELYLNAERFKFYENLKEAEYFAYMNIQNPRTYNNDKVIRGNVGYVNSDFFNIFRFNYLSGRGFTREEETSPVVVMTRSYAQDYFGKTDVIGEKYILLGNVFTVVGVVENPLYKSELEYLSLFLPHVFDNYIPQRYDNHTVYLKAKNKESVPLLSDEINRLHRQAYDKHSSGATPVAREWLPMNLTKETSGYIYWIVIILLLLSIPAFNILSLNTGRIMDQVEEISIKKAYGATREKVMSGILWENVLLTLIGTILGLLLALPFFNVLMSWINSFSPDPLAYNLRIDMYVILVAIAASFLFSVLSGFIPAWVVSGKKIIEGLKGGRL